MSNPIFSDALALALYLPSPACCSREVFSLGGHGSPVVDIYGDRVQCATTLRWRWQLASIFAKAKVNQTIDFFRVFAPLISQPASRLGRDSPHRTALVS